MNTESDQFNGTKLREQREQLVLAEKERNALLMTVVSRKNTDGYSKFSTSCSEIINVCNQGITLSQKKDGWSLLRNETRALLVDTLLEMVKNFSKAEPVARLLMRTQFISLSIDLDNPISVSEHLSCLHIEILKMSPNLCSDKTLIWLCDTVDTGYKYLAAKVVNTRKELSLKDLITV